MPTTWHNRSFYSIENTTLQPVNLENYHLKIKTLSSKIKILL